MKDMRIYRGVMGSYGMSNNEKLLIVNSIIKLYTWIEKKGLASWDPYDALTSNVIKKFTMGNKYLMIAAIQINKISPINLRNVFHMKKGVHPKGLALLSRAFLNLYELSNDSIYLNKAKDYLELLEKNRLHRPSGFCWGPYRPYQTRGMYVEAKEPGSVLTTIVGCSFLDAFEITNNERYLDIAKKCSNFLIKDMLVKNDNGGFFFRYSLSDSEKIIYNAQALIAPFLARVYKYTANNELLKYATEVIDLLVSRQQSEGQWFYGDSPTTVYRQIDFHQGFILDGLYDFIKYSDSKKNEYLDALKKGAEFYKEKQFLPDGRAKWRWPQIWPIDIHNQAQGIITFNKLSEINTEYLNFAKTISKWTIENMQDETGYFYYQKWPFFTNKIPYMRWSQAWMMLALASLLETSWKRATRSSNKCS